MSAAANTPLQPSSQTTLKNGRSATLPPNISTSKPPQYMTMNGNKPDPKEHSMLGHSSSTTSNAPRHSSSAAAATAATINTDTVKQRHRHHGHHSKEKSSNANNNVSNNHSVGLSGGSPADNDAAYCTEIARRSVARAALHLGMEGMEGEALDVLGSVLLGYMDMVGTTISSNVEASGRSSAHSNAYDALNAIVDCTAPAATQLGSAAAAAGGHLPLPGDNQSRLKEVQERGWEGLATFLFGSDWFSIPLEGEDEAAEAALAAGKEANSILGNKDAKILQTNGKATASAAAIKKPGGKTILPSRPPNSSDKKTAMASSPKTSGKGKQLNNMQGSDKTVSFSLERKPSMGADRTDPSGDGPGNDGSGSSDNAPLGRWHAPYLNDIPAFPLVTNTEDVANPHRLPTSLSLSMHDLATEMEACRETPSAAKRPRRGSAASTNSNDKDAKTQTTTKAQRLKEEAAEKATWAALRIPDDVYATIGTVWGSLQDEADKSNDKKEKGTIDGDKKPSADAKIPASKDDGKSAAAAAAAAAAKSKVKFDPALLKQPPPTNTSSPERATASATQRTTLPTRPPYVPNFLPPFPTDAYSDAAQDRLAASASNIMGEVVSQMHHREKRKSSVLSAPSTGDKEKAAASERDSVRRSVIGLGKSAGLSYWGSKWLEDDEDGGAKSKDKNNTVGTFLSDVAVAPGEGGTSSLSSAKKSSSDSSQVMPLGRASGSRLSKILEGSMNVS